MCRLCVAESWVPAFSLAPSKDFSIKRVIGECRNLGREVTLSPLARWTRAGSEHPGIPWPSAFNSDSRRGTAKGRCALSVAREYIYTRTETRTTNQRGRVGAFKIQKATCGFIKAASLQCAGASVHQS